MVGEQIVVERLRSPRRAATEGRAGPGDLLAERGAVERSGVEAPADLAEPRLEIDQEADEQQLRRGDLVVAPLGQDVVDVLDRDQVGARLGVLAEVAQQRAMSSGAQQQRAVVAPHRPPVGAERERVGRRALLGEADFEPRLALLGEPARRVEGRLEQCPATGGMVKWERQRPASSRR